ncbi:DUF1329 domain-containing protein [Pseudomonas sp. L-22-4S-12]|uniref:DUF1329 domain-containing protein n=1 Tax=Pseudomonas sp. L-22-4S-12 TaxID=2610893 RepID=UPI00132804B8|nr:DUF1329 domain-containing protein [Pseudomonas sp. L-22-4S-12]MWV17018.1 DUF1329 domain-containing protein [Pseudomonas sp. L-22-4S-12]
MTKLTRTLIAASLLAAHAGVLHAAVSAEEAQKLGTTLTFVGAEKAGNADGSIPEYTGGLTTAPAGFEPGSGVRPDPFASEKPLFSVDAKNVDQYAAKLTAGSQALLKSKPGYRIDVYQTHRTVAFPQFVLDNTVKNATRASLSADGYSMQNARAGIPFPIPKTGNEVMINHLARYQGVAFILPKSSAFNINAAGKMVLSSQGIAGTESLFYDTSRPADENLLTRSRNNYTGPARRAGEAMQIAEPINYDTGARRAYQYLPGQRRVRLAPDLAYDTPNGSTSGMSTIDDLNLYSGKIDRFDWKLVGKKEIYVPYNTYRFTYAQNPEEVFGPKFINPDVVRWELHRVWVVEGTLKEGQRHIYSKRTYYLDEDSWAALAVDQYDGRGDLWRPGFTYITSLYDQPATNNTPVGHYDLIAGTYYINLWPGKYGVKVSKTPLPDNKWTPDNLAGTGIR